MYLAIDIGGTKTLIALFGRLGFPVKQLKFPTSKDLPTFLSDLRSALSSVVKHPEKIQATTIAIPSAFSNGLPIKAPNLPDWDCQKFPTLVEELFKKFGITTPVFYKNDADLGAFYECRSLSGNTLYLTFGTGIGGALLKDGQLTPESESFEPGHIDNWEKIASSKAIRAANNDLDVLKISNPTALKDVAVRISQGLKPLLTQYSPDQVVLTGPIIDIFPKFRPYLLPILNTKTPILPAKKPQKSVIYGAYLYAKQQIHR